MLNPLHPSRIQALQNLDPALNLNHLIQKADQLLSKSVNVIEEKKISKKETWDKPWDYYVALEKIKEVKEIADKLSDEQTIPNDLQPINPWASNNQSEIDGNIYLLPISKKLSASYASKAGKGTLRLKFNQILFSAKSLLKKYKNA